MSSYRVSISHINVQAREILHVISNSYDIITNYLINFIVFIVYCFYLKIFTKNHNEIWRLIIMKHVWCTIKFNIFFAGNFLSKRNYYHK